MAPVHKIIVKEAEPVLSSEDVYCVCRQSHSNGFMICCDNCNEWFHGDCIGMPEDIGIQHDTFYCGECCRRNPLLKSTYKANPPSTARAQRDSDPMPKTPKKARIINSAGVRQRPRRKSTFIPEPAEAPLPKTPAPKTPKRRGKSSKTEIQEAVKVVDGVKEKPDKPTAVDQRPKRTAKKKDPKPVDEFTEDDPKPAKKDKKLDLKPLEKTFESKGIQCDLLKELAQQVPKPSGKKKGTCFTAFCNLIARPDSRYCCDECGNFTALTNAFAIHLLPIISNDKLAKTYVSYMVSDSKNNHKSKEKSQSTEPEVENESRAKGARAERRKSRYRSPSNSLAKGPDLRKTPAKKPKLPEELSSSRSRSSRKSVAEPRDITPSDSESQQNSRHKTAKDSRTSSKRIYSKTPCEDSKSSRSYRNASKTAPNSPVAQKKTSKQKHATQSPPVQKRVGRKRKLSADVASTYESKAPQVSRTGSTESTSRSRNPVPSTSNQKKRKQSFSEAISYDTTFENSEKIKTISCIVSNMVPKEKALLARKRMMKKLSSEQQPRQPPGDLQKETRNGHSLKILNT
ncbi:death-inducer obliterator 1 [Drosophila erecta]|uniref:death-inducer obliterator 1 n=1 Tax=Drosophila erecta TaxID=7220 RepID=UPI000F045E4F|nr:death-inducer obliterator 1 [Drosophila erecta]